MLQIVDHGGDLRFARRLQDHREQARRAGKIALPDRMARIVGQGRIEHTVHLRPVPEPPGDNQGVLLMLFQADAQRAQAAQAEITLFGARAAAHRIGGDLHFLEKFGAHGDDAEHRVRMADDILRRRVDRQIDAEIQRPEKERGGPGIVDAGPDAALPGNGRDRGDILHLHGLGARRFEPDQAGIRADQRRDSGAGRGIVVGRLDAEGLQEIFGQLADRLIGAVAHQKMIAALDRGENGGGAARHARRYRNGPVGAFERGDRLLERLCGRRAEPAVDHVVEHACPDLPPFRHGAAGDR